MERGRLKKQERGQGRVGSLEKKPTAVGGIPEPTGRAGFQEEAPVNVRRRLSVDKASV